MKGETQETINQWSKDREDARTPDEVMHGFLDRVKDLEVVWFTGEYFEVFDAMGDVLVDICLTAGQVNVDLLDAMNAAMSRRRKEI